MLEDFAMEKKSSGRPVQAPVKGSCTEFKKTQELAGSSKTCPRTVRRRDPTQLSTPKNDGSRRPTPQRSRYLDKRPRSKGQFISSGKEDTQVGESIPEEYDTVALSGKKKQNLNHLLNFHYAPRVGGVSAHHNWRQSQAGWGRRSFATHKHKYNKEQFLQANCQFVVRQASDYMEYMSNPDLLVDWDRIEQINYRTTEEVSCPICLYPPTAAKMTRCGHIFCWSCILHYLALSDKQCRKCPICFVPTDKFDLKSVVVMKHTQYLVGDEVVLRLMRRERGCLVPVPVNEQNYPVQNRPLSVSEKEHSTTYSKLLLATPKEVLDIIARERTELENQLVSEDDCPERCFTEQAVELLKEREFPLCTESLLNKPSHTDNTAAKIETLRAKHGDTADYLLPETSLVKVYKSSWDDAIVASMPVSNIQQCPTTLRDFYDFYDCVLEGDNISLHESERQRFESFSSEGLGSEDGMTSLTIEDLELPAMRQSPPTSGTTVPKCYFFYQAADGQHVYLHAMNVRMLEHQYGNLEQCPHILKGRILEKESGSMTEELRHRLRYLQHLPVTCQFDVVEIQLRPPVINRNTVELFQDQLEARKRRRQRRARDERRREKRIDEEEKRRMGRYPSPVIRLQSHKQFPQCGGDSDYAGFTLSSSPVTDAYSLPETDISASMNALSLEGVKASVPEDLADNASGPSFAQMLREGKGRGPERKAAQSKLKLKVHRSSHSSEDEQEMQDHVPAPCHQQFLSEAIAKAMEKAAEARDSAQDGASRGKKKKQKQKVLFTTGMAYSNK